MEAKILKTVLLDKDKVLTVDSEWDVFLRDERNNNRKAFFTGKRFVKFMQMMHDVDRVIGKASDGKDVTVKLHLGGAWFLSVTPGMACVDLRKFYQDRNNDIKPSKLGIALNFSEWDSLMNAAATINDELKGFQAISTCWHQTDDELHNCNECTPFK